MANQDLDWDHSAGESLLNNTRLDEYDSEQFDDVALFSGQADQTILSETGGNQTYISISKRQLAYILRSLDEASSVLHEQAAVQNAHNTNSTRPNGGSQREQTSRSNRRCGTCVKKSLNFIINYNLVVTFLLQLTMMVLLQIIDSSLPALPIVHENKKSTVSTNFQVSCVIMLVLMIVNLIVIVYMSVKLTQRIILFRMTVLHLGQAYISTLLCFAGAYVVTYRLNNKSWTLHGFANSTLDDNPVIVTYLFLKMLFHSISTSTLCGASIIHPNQWYNFILMAVQMLLSFVYFTSILGQIIHSRPPTSPTESRQLQNMQRRHSFTSITSTRSNERTRLLNTSNGGPHYGGL